METFPNWSPDGKTLYYCNCELDKVLDLETMPDSMIAREIALRYNLIKYSLKKVDFDPQTQAFGEPQMVVDAPAKGKSITLPRVSPDGRYVLYTEGDYGQFHIWHKSSDLWVKDLQADTCYALKPANSKDVDSYHTWSSNGRWIVFSSRRDDGNYTRPYIAYFDKNGKARKAFMLPHEDPEYTLLLLRSYNVPELTTDAVTIPASDLRECIYGSDGEKAKYTK
jgi:Tol biopolymer transport system component